MRISRRIALDLNNKQRAAVQQHAGVARHAWNWGLEICKNVLEVRKQEKEVTGKPVTKFPTAIDLHKRLVAEVKKENPWYYDVSKCAPQQALRDLEVAFKRVIKVKGTGFPNFKKRTCKQAFYLEAPVIRTDGKKIRLPSIGWVKTKEVLNPDHVIKQVRISQRAGKWFVSYTYEVTPVVCNGHTDVVGVDLGVKTFATLSTGEQIVQPKQLRLQKKLVRTQRKLSRQTKGSKRRNKTKQKLGKIHYRIACIRSDLTHKTTSRLAKNHGVIAIEDLCVSGMLKNRCLARSIANANFSEFRRQLEYKTLLYGSQLVVVDRWFPSSKTCNVCQHKQDVPLSKRLFCCESCGHTEDRDVNAAKNLRAVSLTVLAQRTPAGGSLCEPIATATCSSW